MTESSTDTKQKTSTDTGADKGTDKGTENKTVPLEALGESRAKTRAANERADKAEAELAKAKEQGQFPIDMDALVQTLAAETRKTVEAELAPLRQEATRYKMAASLGLSEDQASKVMEIRGKNPGLTDQQALTLARVDHPDAFPSSQPTWDRARHGGLPVSGSAPPAPQNEDFVAKMNKARESKDWAGAQHFAEQEALRRFRDAFNNRSR